MIYPGTGYVIIRKSLGSGPGSGNLSDPKNRLCQNDSNVTEKHLWTNLTFSIELRMNVRVDLELGTVMLIRIR
jgi:hypothetical protein